MSNILSETELAELICTRISHDVIGNVGAVANAVELLEEGDMDFLDDIRSILKVSSSVLSARLKFFRLAFGLTNANLDSCEGVRAATEAYLQTVGSKNHPLALDFSLENSDFCRQAMIAVMIAADTMVKGGTIEVRDAGTKLAVVCSSPAPLSAEKISNIKAIISGERPENAAQYAPVFYLASLLAQKEQVLKIIDEPAFGLVIEQR